MDNNLAQSTIEQYNRLANDMAEHFKLTYDDPRSRTVDYMRRCARPAAGSADTPTRSR